MRGEGAPGGDFTRGVATAHLEIVFISDSHGSYDVKFNIFLDHQKLGIQNVIADFVLI